MKRLSWAWTVSVAVITCAQDGPAAVTAPPFGETTAGEQLDPAIFGPGIVESMAEVIARDRAAPRRGPGDRDQPRFRYGKWVVPSRRATTFPHSGEHNVVNKVGDTRLGIGFAGVVDVHGAYFAGQAARGAWTTGIRVVGYLDGTAVGATDWFRGIGEIPTWLEMELCGVDRIVILCEPVIDGAGWYSMDDLAFSRVEAHGQETFVIDFEDASFNTTLSGSDYAGLIWEYGTGFELSEPVHAPKVPPDVEVSAGSAAGGGHGKAIGRQDGGTLPEFVYSFRGVIRGDAGSWSYPPDAIGAIGPNHFLEVVNRNFAVYDRPTGNRLVNVNLASFLPGANGDPRVLFDQHSQRWITIATDFDSGQHIYLAVSFTDNPMGDWFKTDFSTDLGSDWNRWPDYPTLGVDANGIYTAAYMVGGSNKMTLWAIDKAPLIAPTPSLGTITAFRELPWEGAIQPAHTYGTPEGAYCVSLYDAASLRVRRVDPPLTAPTLTEAGLLNIPFHSAPPDAPALGSSTDLDTVGNRLMMAVYRDGSLWTCHTVDVDGRAGCRWYQIDPTALTLQQSGTVSDEILHYFYPSLMVNRFGHVAMAFSGSSPSHYAGAYYTGRLATDPPGEMGRPILYQAGAAPQNNIDGFGRNRWGDYSYTTLDPNNEIWLWTIQEYAHANDIWGTQVALLAPGDVCDPPSVIVEGCRTLRVTPVGDTSQALFIGGDPSDSGVSCVSRYVRLDGTLGPTAEFRPPALWGTVTVRGTELIPGASYRVHADCGLPVGAELSAPAPAVTWMWGDVESPPNDLVNLKDIMLVIFAYQGNFAEVTLERADMHPCTPDGVIGVGDILGVVGAFQGLTYADTGCPMPCP